MSDLDTRYQLLAPPSGIDNPTASPRIFHQAINSSSYDMFRSNRSEKKDDSSEGGETFIQDAEQTAKKALEKVDQLEQTQNLTILSLQRLVKYHEKAAATKRKVDLLLYPWVLFVVVLNLFLWISMLYAISEASYYGHNKHRYYVYAWLIFLIPVILSSFFIFTPWPSVIREGRVRFTASVASPTSKNLINIANAIACFVAAAAYLFLSAIPQYNTVDWTMSVDYLNDLPVPAFALLIDDASINFAREKPLASAWMYDGTTGNWISYETDGIYQFNSSDYNDIEVLVFNSTALSTPNITSPTWQYFYYQTNVTYNSSAHDDSIPGEPQLWVAAFDSRLSVTEMLDCGIQPWYLINAYSISSLSTTVMHITDTLRTVEAPAGAPAYCSSVFQDKLSQTAPKFALYELTTSANSPSVPSYAKDCDVAANSSARCPLTINLSYGNQFVLDRQTAHGISELDIWLNLGAIVGAVQFVAWFMLQAVGG